MKGGIFIPYVPVPKDLTTVKTKVAFNLTKRQLICFGLAAAVAVPTYFLTRGALGTTGAVMTLVIAALPFFFLAMRLSVLRGGSRKSDRDAGQGLSGGGAAPFSPVRSSTASVKLFP